MVAQPLEQQSWLDSICDTIEALNTTAYQWDASDGWRRALYAEPEAGATSHLEFLVTFGGISEWGKGQILQPGSLRFVSRYSPDDDNLSQARIQAAMLAACYALQGWRTHRCRAQPTSAEVEGLSSEWVAVTVAFTLIHAHNVPLNHSR